MGKFQISITNKGLELAGEDVEKCIERGWRGERAVWTTAEGSGIGLWIVRHVMDAHGGQLVIVPTTKDHQTEIKLIFS